PVIKTGIESANKMDDISGIQIIENT
ncbi:MAG: hypothetical protein RIR05_432, partial [Bacteroidota bacterium]